MYSFCGGAGSGWYVGCSHGIINPGGGGFADGGGCGGGP